MESDAMESENNLTKNELLQQLQMLNTEKQIMQQQFASELAKVKQLFIQKENEYIICQEEKQKIQHELDDLKSQFLVADLNSESEARFKEMKAHEEISSLQQLVQDTIEESSICKTELDRLRIEYDRLHIENKSLREELQHMHAETSGLAPQVLSQVRRTLVRKLGGDANSANSVDNTHQDNSDQLNRRKSALKHHEDDELLHSIVPQLQEEMSMLKEKLREADEKLQCSQKSNNELNEMQINKSTSMESLQCTNCQSINVSHEHLKKENNILKKDLKELKENLQKEEALRKDLENQWQEKREEHKFEVQLLREQVKASEEKLLDLQQTFLETKDEVLKKLHRLSDEREKVNKQLETLQADNDFLSGRFLETADEIENQYINLPNNVEELHELLLKQQNDLIQARLGNEFERKKCVTTQDEIQLLREQLNVTNNERRTYKKKVQVEMKSLQDRLTEHLLILQQSETKKTELQRKESELNKQILELRVELIELKQLTEKNNNIIADLKAKNKNLQEDLVLSEQVQKDFVNLSQNLQMSLEQLRHADTEVRWQDDEDVDNCPICKVNFTVTVRKAHCRHCGHIFCEKCLTKTVPSGPRRKNARVCDICHTLLKPNIAPYFSHEAPKT